MNAQRELKIGDRVRTKGRVPGGPGGAAWVEGEGILSRITSTGAGIQGKGITWESTAGNTFTTDHPANWLRVNLSDLELVDDTSFKDRVARAVADWPEGCRDQKEKFLKSLGLEWPLQEYEVVARVKIKAESMGHAQDLVFDACNDAGATSTRVDRA